MLIFVDFPYHQLEKSNNFLTVQYTELLHVC